jgi:hypothetical protein
MSNDARGAKSGATAMAEAVRKFLPGPGDPPEPYFALVGVTAHGEATGDLWGAEPRTVTLFEGRELGAQVLKVAGPPSPEPQGRTIRWEVRGLSKEALRWLQGEPSLAPRIATGVSGGRVATRPL